MEICQGGNFMKHYLISLCLMLVSGISYAQKTITVIWPFGVGDTQAQYSRSLIETVNDQQKKYTLIFNNKPGAGATVAAKYVGEHADTVLAGTTSFFVRPIFFPNESHNTSQFRPLMTQCSAPMVIISSKYRSWKDLDTNQRITIGISGMGATTHLIAMEIKQKYPGIDPIAYKGTREASIDVMNGALDLAVGFMGEVEPYIDDGKLYALGITGNRSVKKIPLLANQGFENAQKMVNMHSWLVPITMPEDEFQSLRKLVVTGSKHPSVQSAYQADYCQPSNLDEKQTQAWFDNQLKLWVQLSQGVIISQ